MTPVARPPTARSRRRDVEAGGTIQTSHTAPASTTSSHLGQRLQHHSNRPGRQAAFARDQHARIELRTLRIRPFQVLSEPDVADCATVVSVHDRPA